MISCISRYEGWRIGSRDSFTLLQLLKILILVKLLQLLQIFEVLNLLKLLSCFNNLNEYNYLTQFLGSMAWTNTHTRYIGADGLLSEGSEGTRAGAGTIAGAAGGRVGNDSGPSVEQILTKTERKLGQVRVKLFRRILVGTLFGIVYSIWERFNVD
jgi:hypothetical protein